MSYADSVFIANCKEILTSGVWDTDQAVRPKWADGTRAHTVKKFGIVNRYNLAEEFPLVSHSAGLTGNLLSTNCSGSGRRSRTTSKICTRTSGTPGLMRERFPLGRLTAISLASNNEYAEGLFDQVDRVIYDLKHNPASRRILTNIYNFADLHEMALYPCAYSMTFNVSGRTLNAILNPAQPGQCWQQTTGTWCSTASSST